MKIITINSRGYTDLGRFKIKEVSNVRIGNISLIQNNPLPILRMYPQIREKKSIYSRKYLIIYSIP